MHTANLRETEQGLLSSTGIFCYKAISQQGTDESPFFLMFSREPSLPINVLLGWVHDPAPGEV